MALFFDNIFYWFWRITPSKGFPDRSFALLTVMQFSYVLFVVILIWSALPAEVKLSLYENPKPVAVPVMVIYIVLLIVNSRMYDEKRYKQLCRIYEQMSAKDIRKRKTRFLLFTLLTIIIALLDILLLTYVVIK